MPKTSRRWDKGRYSSVVKLIGRPIKDGRAYEAVRFVHFTCSPHGFMSQLYAMARDYDMGVSCASTSTRVIYRFYDKRGPWRPNMQAFPVVIKAKAEEERA